MTLIKLMHAELRWLISLGRKLWHLTPRQLGIAITAFTVSRGFMLLAMILPIKVIILAAVDGVPWYLRFLIDDPSNKSLFLILLASGALASYGLYHLCARLVQKTVSEATEQVLSEANKLYLFPNQTDVARKGYERFVQVVGSGIIILLGFAAGIWLDPVVFGGLIVAILLELAVTACILSSRSRLAERATERLRDNIEVAATSFSSANFLLIFVLLLVQFIIHDHLSIIIAIVSIILVRQVLQNAASLIKSVSSLSRNRHRLTTLFYATEKHVPVTDRRHHTFTHELRPGRRSGWLAGVVEDVAGVVGQNVHSNWIDSGTPGIAWFDTVTDQGRWLVKLYSPRQEVKAAHEAELFATHSNDLPAALPFVGECLTEQGRALVFDMPGVSPVEKQHWRVQAIEQMLQLWMIVPHDTLIDIYCRTHTMVFETLDVQDFDLLKIACRDKRDRHAVAAFTQNWPSLRQRIAKLPVMINNPEILDPSSCVVDDEQNIFCLNWTNWMIEPIGCEANLLKLNSSQLSDILQLWDEWVMPHVPVTRNDISISAQLAKLEKAFRRDNFAAGLDAVRTIVAETEYSSVGSQATRVAG